MKMRYKMSEDLNLTLSKHFKVFEFSSTYPNPYNPKHIYSDTIIIEEKLIEKLEKLMIMLNCDYAYITSGYRSPEHDIDVGGDGNGQHTKGNAVDVKFKSQKGYWINTQIVSFMAQVVGFTGIARINDTTIHLDVRENSIYYGDETKSQSTVTKDFKDYYKITNDILIDYLLKLWR